MATKEYSCVKKTKKAFAMSLALLAKEHQLNKITVKMLCENAQLSRNAFYFHYKDINALINDIENNLVDEAAEMINELEKLGFPKSVYATIDGLIDLFDEHKDIVIMLLDTSYSTSFTERISKIFSDFNYDFFKQVHSEKSKVSYEFFYMYIANGFYGIIRYWLENPDKMSKASLKGLTYTLVKRLLVPGDPDIEKYNIPSSNNN